MTPRGSSSSVEEGFLPEGLPTRPARNSGGKDEKKKKAEHLGKGTEIGIVHPLVGATAYAPGEGPGGRGVLSTLSPRRPCTARKEQKPVRHGVRADSFESPRCQRREWPALQGSSLPITCMTVTMPIMNPSVPDTIMLPTNVGVHRITIFCTRRPTDAHTAGRGSSKRGSLRVRETHFASSPPQIQGRHGRGISPQGWEARVENLPG